MPGPKMGPRPADFDEEVVRQAPTFHKWLKLQNGEKLRYACRDFVKGHGDDEERLMRRIMIARRNNLRDHETLKRARQTTRTTDTIAEEVVEKKEKKPRRTNTGGMSDAQVMREMDVPAVEATRSYRQWAAMEDGEEFTYNQKYIKGKEGHDWLLRKNIWRRMRYRRENKKMVELLKGVAPTQDAAAADSDMTAAAATHIVDHALLASAAAAATTSSEGNDVKNEDAAAAGSHEFVSTAVVEAAVAAAESYVKEQTTEDAVDSSLSTIAAMSVPSTSEMRVHNPLEAAASNEALDAAAKLAAAAVPPSLEEDVGKQAELVLREDESSADSAMAMV